MLKGKALYRDAALIGTENNRWKYKRKEAAARDRFQATLHCVT